MNNTLNLVTEEGGRATLPRPEIEIHSRVITMLDRGATFYICEQEMPLVDGSELLASIPHCGAYIFPQGFDVACLDKYTPRKKDTRIFNFNKLSVDELNRRIFAGLSGVRLDIKDTLTEFEPTKVFRRVYDKIGYP